MSFFRNMNRKQKRAFAKADKEEKLVIFAHELSQKLKVEHDKGVAIGFSDGFLFAYNMIYEKYYEDWSKAKYNDKHKIAKELMEEVLQKEDVFKKRFPDKNEQVKTEEVQEEK